MAHLSRGIDSPHLRQPIIKMIIKGFAHSDALRSKLEKKLGRFLVTIPVLKYIKRKLNNINWPTEKKHRVWAVATLLWDGSLRCHKHCLENAENMMRQTHSFLRMLSLAMPKLVEVGKTAQNKT